MNLQVLRYTDVPKSLVGAVTDNRVNITVSPVTLIQLYFMLEQLDCEDCAIAVLLRFRRE